MTRLTDAEVLLTPSEVASLFRVDPKTVTRWAKAGKLTSIRTLGGHRRYRESEVRELIKESLKHSRLNQRIGSLPMNFSLTQFLILGLATFLFVGGLTPVMRKIALKIGAVDSPNLERKTQKEPVPYLGGVGICDRHHCCIFRSSSLFRFFN